MINRPPRLKDMDRKDKFTLAKLGWSLRFGLGTESMRGLRVGGINIYDVLNETFDNSQLKAAIAVDAVMGQHMGPRHLYQFFPTFSGCGHRLRHPHI